MAQTPHQTAHRCLPLLIASQAGWVVNCPVNFNVTWTGRKMRNESLEIQFSENAEHWGRYIISNFGYGIVTFKMPWLFRTSKGLGLMVRGPSNYYKDHVAPLEGLVETDWMPSTFTMNWKIVKPKTPIWFRKGEPICMLTPYPIALLEEIQPKFATMDSNPELQEQYAKWHEQRLQQKRDARAPGATEVPYKLDYMRGSTPDGAQTEYHWSSLKLAKFEGENAAR